MTNEEFFLVNRLVAYLSEQKDRRFIKISDLARDTGTPPHEVLSIFGAAGIQPDSWSAPSDYSIETITEALTRHEVGNRYNRAS
jgi:hypothetical protein